MDTIGLNASMVNPAERGETGSPRAREGPVILIPGMAFPVEDERYSLVNGEIPDMPFIRYATGRMEGLYTQNRTWVGEIQEAGPHAS